MQHTIIMLGLMSRYDVWIMLILIMMMISSIGSGRMVRQDNEVTSGVDGSSLNVVMVYFSGQVVRHFNSIQDAVDSIPDGNTTPTILTLHAGTYK
mgnify:FL=1